MNRIQKFEDSLKDHIYGTYFSSRMGLIVVGFSLPIILFIGGLVYGKMLQPSFSQYYHTPMRNIFVGLLFGISAVLFLYKGFSDRENWSLNIAAVCLLFVALFPTAITMENQVELEKRVMSAEVSGSHSKQEDSEKVSEGAGTQKVKPNSLFGRYCPYIHGTFAVIFFLCVAFVCFFCAHDTFDLFDDPAMQGEYRRKYFLIGFLTVALPVLVLVIELIDRVGSMVDQWYPVFWLEAVAVWVFAYYWLIKRNEFKHHLKDKDMSEFLHTMACRRAEPGNEDGSTADPR